MLNKEDAQGLAQGTQAVVTILFAETIDKLGVDLTKGAWGKQDDL